MKISIIVPAYNDSKFINQCIYSLINQSYDNLEIILIDDGSTDSTLEIMNSYAAKDKRIKVYHKENGGAGDARNYAIGKSRGDFLVFVDADDWIRYDTIELLVKEQTRTRVDAVFFDFKICDERTGVDYSVYENEKYIGNNDWVKDKLDNCIYPSCCMGMYNKNVWIKNNVFFPKVAFEDNYTYPFVLLAFRNHTIVPERLYFYRINHKETHTRNLSNDKIKIDTICMLLRKMQDGLNWNIYKENLWKYANNQLKVSMNNVAQAEAFNLKMCISEVDRKLSIFYPEKQGEFERNYSIDGIIPKISIIVPVHNSEKYLIECLDSIEKQTITDYEVLCIDDDSSDKTKEIICEYVNKDGRFKYLYDPNSSYGHKINLGIRLAKGEYFAILESDDFWAEDMLESLYSVTRNYLVDYVDSDFYRFTGENGHYKKELAEKYPNHELYSHLVVGNENLESLGGGTSAIWTGLYRTSFIKDSDIVLNESEGASYQDTSFRFLIGVCARNSYHIRRPLYFYRCDNDTSSVKDVTKAFVIVDEYAHLKDILLNRNLFSNDIKGYFFSWKYVGYDWNVKRLSTKLRNSFIQEFYKQVKNDQKEYASIESRERWGMLEWADDFLMNPDNKGYADDFSTKIVQFGLDKQIVIYGAGKVGRKLCDEIDKNFWVNIKCFCDSNEDLIGQEYNYRKIESLRSVLECKEHIGFIIASKKYSNEIYELLVRNGVKEKDILQLE